MTTLYFVYASTVYERDLVWTQLGLQAFRVQTATHASAGRGTILLVSNTYSSSCLRFAWYSWNRVRSTLLSILLDSCFGLVGPLQQPAIDSNVDPALNHLYQASAPAAGIQDSNEVMPPAAHSCVKRRALKPSAANNAVLTKGHARKIAANSDCSSV